MTGKSGVGEERPQHAAVPAELGQEAKRLRHWVGFSGLLHGGIIVALLVAPSQPLRSRLSYPVYTIDLVGGESLGGKATKQPPIISQVEERPTPAEIKSVETSAKPTTTAPREQKTPPRPVEEKEEMVFKESQKSVKREEKSAVESRPGVSKAVREKLIQSALERIRSRVEGGSKKEEESVSTGDPNQRPGAASLGPGKSGGGIVKGVEFIRYYNRMLQSIRERWTWAGKRDDLEVTVRFGIRESGEIFGLRVLRASGDPSYDDSVVRAVRRASPLASPPEQYRSEFSDVELIFRPKDLT
jgi:colicin import membrane protein